MSQAILNDEATLPSSTVADRVETSPSTASGPADELSDFDYKPVPPYAPLAAVIAIVSATALYAEIVVLLALAGMFVGGFAVLRIRKANGALGGKNWARIGLFGSTIFFFTGIATHTYAYMTEVPEGHLRVSFSRDISAKQFAYVNGVRELHPDVAPLDGKKIFIKGFMWNTQKQTGLEDFVLLKDNGKCCFGGAPKPYDMMVVKMKNGKTVNKLAGLVSVAGTLKCYPQSSTAVYILEATYVARARTSH
jgi:hypothetical protein